MMRCKPYRLITNLNFRWKTRFLSTLATDNVRVGQVLHGFVVKDIEPVPELHLTALRLCHEKLGCDYLHINRDDLNNVFSVAFRTVPENSWGVPHILEHICLCGSQKYPVKDPFMKMLNRSLATFMNAYTANDWTMYPISSQNRKDLQNLMQVYLDAAFFPILRDVDFRQEGWRLEHSDIRNSDSPLIIKGVVYNEMKGVFSNSAQLYCERILNNIFPTTTYSYCSGGDPANIPELTIDYLRKFHSNFYHPSNARFFSYGNFPVESHLQLINDLILSKFSSKVVNSDIPSEKRWDKEKIVHISSYSDPLAPSPEKQTTVSVTYLLKENISTYENFCLNILSTLLIDGPNSPFHQALIESSIGSDYSPGTGFDAYNKESYFSVGLQGIHYNDIESVRKRITEVFDQVEKNGFPKERIESILHSIELSTKHQTSNFGLSLILNIIAPWNHGGNPIQSLKVNSHIEYFRKQLEDDPQYLQSLISKYFKKNMHRLVLIMSPSENYETERLEMEKKLTDSLISKLTTSDKKRIYEEGIELEEFQQKEENTSCLPTLLISDIERNVKKVGLSHLNLENGVPVQISEQPTNGITYFRAITNISHIPENLKIFIPLFCDVVTKMGAANRNYKEFDQEVELRTGGLNVGMHLSEDPVSPYAYEQGLLFSSYCLDKNIDHMFDLWKDVTKKVNFEQNDRLSQLIRMSASNLNQDLSNSGHQYAIRLASSNLSPAASLREKMGGLSQVIQMKKLAEMTDLNPVIRNLQEIASLIFNANYLRFKINTTPESVSKSCQGLEKFAMTLPGQLQSAFVKSEDPLFKTSAAMKHFVLPFSVNFLGKSFKLPSCIEKDYACMKIISRLLTFKYLLREIREKGGAYGGGATISGGTFSFFSYRDPKSLETLKVFNDAVDWIVSGKFKDSDINEAKLSVFQEVDHPISPGDRGNHLFISGLTDEIKQKHREQLLDVQRSDLLEAAHKYFANKEITGTCLFGPENKDISEEQGWEILKSF